VTPAGRRIRTLYQTELRTLLRDRRMVVMSLILPLLVTPVLLFAGRWMEERRSSQLAQFEYRYAIAGQRPGDARAVLTPALGEPAGENDRASFREIEAADAGAALDAREVDLYFETASAADLVRRSTDPGDRVAVDPDERVRAIPGDVLAVTVVFRGDRDQSQSGAALAQSRLREARVRTRTSVLSRAGLTITPAELLPIELVNLAGDVQLAGLALGRFATLLLLLFLFTGAAVVAQDTLAGEKERGTLETLLTTAVTRREVVVAKLLLVVTVAIVITTIQVGNLLAYARLQVIPSAARLAEVVTPLMAVGLLIFLLPLAALISAALLLSSGYAKSYREAQFNFMPILLLAALPAVAGALPGMSLRSAIVVVPVANISVGVREILMGRIDVPFLTAAWLVTAAAAGWIMRMTERALSTERLIVPSAAEAPGPLGQRRLTAGGIFTWFAAMWAILLLVSLNVGTDFDIRAQLVVNLIGIFLGGSLLFVRRYALRPRDVLLLARPPWQSWVAVLAGAPATLIVGIGVARLANLVVPVPEEVVESFGQYLAPEQANFWLLLPMLTLVPGVCEEIAFRGVLLQSLRRFFKPATAVIIAGLVFGFFHVSLFRLFPTAFLGIILSIVTLLSGSIFPAMLWHALNNGIALVAGHYEVALGLLPPTVYASATAISALSIWILWRSRRLVTFGQRS
jgi:sodium transport system permease protein